MSLNAIIHVDISPISRYLLISLLIFFRREENTLNNSAPSLRDSCEVNCITDSHNRVLILLKDDRSSKLSSKPKPHFPVYILKFIFPSC